jgi:uncharacterized protein YifE (UPF0438 family)
MARTPPPKLIAPFIKRLVELDKGLRAPMTALQVHFVEVCRGGAQPTTAYERAYLEWRAKEERRRKLELNEARRQKESNRNRDHEPSPAAPLPVPGRWADPKPYARFVAEPLGTREDFRKDKAANFAASRRNKI